MYTPDQHKFLSFAAEQIEKARKEWGAPHSYIRQLKGGSRYRLSGDADAFNDDLRKIHRDASDAFFEYVHNLQHAMHKIRLERREVEAYRPMARHERDTRRAASTTLDSAFPRSRFDLWIKGENSKHSYEVGVSTDGSDYWVRNHVIVSQAWSKTVYERGIPIINSSKGLRFVLSAKPKDVRGVTETTRVFEVKTFGIHQKKAFREDGWLMVHGSSTQMQPVWDFTESEKKYAQNNVHAFHQYLGDCKALFDRRVKKYVLDQFDI